MSEACSDCGDCFEPFPVAPEVAALIKRDGFVRLCPECAVITAEREIERLRATGNACHRLVSYLYDRERTLYDHASLDSAPIPAAAAEVGLREVRRAIAVVMAFTLEEREYFQERSMKIEKLQNAAKAVGGES